jgi:UDP-sugar transporter A1/2/3
MNEILKGTISLVIAFARIDPQPSSYELVQAPHASPCPFVQPFMARVRKLWAEVMSPDCWRLSIPAILYGNYLFFRLPKKQHLFTLNTVIQNNLQYVAASNLEAATFQVTYQMKILTTAGFSVLLLRKSLSPSQWLSLLFLSIGVGIVQIQTGVDNHRSVGGDISAGLHTMNPMKGFMAVVSACFTSGLAGVYFEMVLKNSQANLWVRNVQLSLFSLLPALAPIIFIHSTQSGQSLFSVLFNNFGAWAWATVFVQVLGGLVTAMVIKYSDNILKGFATSLSIVLSFLASVALFDFQMSITFILGSTVVLIATWLYNQHPTRFNMAINKETWIWLKSEKNPSSLRSPPINQQFGKLPAISSQASLSSVTSSLAATPLSETLTFIRQ